MATVHYPDSLTQTDVSARLLVDWDVARDVARVTAGLEPDGKVPDSDWIRRMLLAEHSPIRAVTYLITMTNVPYWVSVHLVRHKVGVEHYVSTQRPDRTKSGVDRHSLPQDAPVTHVMVANAAALIAMSRKRLCNRAAPETQEAWRRVVEAVRAVDPVMAEFMRPECVYRHGCPEPKSCGGYEKAVGKAIRAGVAVA